MASALFVKCLQQQKQLKSRWLAKWVHCMSDAGGFSHFGCFHPIYGEIVSK